MHVKIKCLTAKKLRIMKTQNTFAVTGRITKDAEVKNFANNTVARTGLAINRKETVNGEEKKTAGFMDIECWRKNDNTAELELLKKGQMVTVYGFFKPEEYEKDGKTVHKIAFAITKVEKFEFEQKEA